MVHDHGIRFRTLYYNFTTFDSSSPDSKWRSSVYIFDGIYSKLFDEERPGVAGRHKVGDLVP